MEKRYVLSVLMMLTLTLFADAQIGISPPRTEFMIDDAVQTHSIRVFNVGSQEVNVSVDINHWDLDEQNNVRIIPPSEQSLDQWMIINPLHFTLEPGGSQAVRFAVRPRIQPEPGEHRALVYFSQVPNDETPESIDQPRILFRFGTSVIGLVDPVVRDGIIHEVSADDEFISFVIESRGNTHVRLRGQWALWPTALFPGRENTAPVEGLDAEDVVLPEGMITAGSLSLTPVLPGTRRTVTTPIAAKLEPGDYVFDLHGKVGDTDIGRTITFEVAPNEEAKHSPSEDE